MDPVKNPYAPGAGTPPPELAGRSDVLESARIALQRIALGNPTKSMILVGLRGVGKTVLLTKIAEEAQALNFKTVSIEAHEGKTLPEMLAPHLRSILYQLSMIENAKEKAKRGLMALKGMIGAIKVTVSEIELGLSIDTESGLADSGDLEADLVATFITVGEAARSASKYIAIIVDELQYLSEKEFSAIIMSIHRINQLKLPIILIGAGLPQILGLAGNSKSYAERLFNFPEIGALSEKDAILAIVNPAKLHKVTFSNEAVSEILIATHRYPYFLQQWAYEAWNVSPEHTISKNHVEKATILAIKELDQSFFKVRFDRCTPSEKKYMRALAEFGSGKHRSGDIAEKMGVKVTSVAPTRSALIQKGMIYSPSHGDTAFTVPLFDQYMLRAIPQSS